MTQPDADPDLFRRLNRPRIEPEAKKPDEAAPKDHPRTFEEAVKLIMFEGTKANTTSPTTPQVQKDEGNLFKKLTRKKKVS